MAKRKPKQETDPLDPTPPAPEGPAVTAIDSHLEQEPQVDVRMRGSAEAVSQRLSRRKQEPTSPAAADAGEGGEKKRFLQALKNPRFSFRVKRTYPDEFQGIQTNVEVWSSELPISYQEIIDQVSGKHRGGKYRVAIYTQDNELVAADTFKVEGDPAVPEIEGSEAERARIFMEGQPKDASAITEEGLEQRARVSAKLLHVEELEAQLKEARERRKKPEADGGVRDTRVDDIERRLTEAKHQAELEARDRRHAEEIRELKAMIAQNAAPAKPQNDMMMVMLEQMREDRKASQAQFTALLTQIKDDKLTAVLEEVKAIKNKPNQQSSSLLDQAEAILKLKKVFGWGGDDDDDDDDDAVDPDDKRPWWERALDKLGGKFGDKLLAKFTDMEDKGEVVDREKFMREISDQVTAEVVSKQRQALPPPPKPSALPAPPPAAPAAPTQVQQLPPPPPAGEAPAAQLPPPPPAAPVQQNPPTLTIEQEITIRVGIVLDMLDREATFRANEYQWNYEGCWMKLPDDLLEKVCAAADGAGVVDALTTPLLAAEKIAELKTKLSSNPKTAAWFMVGLNELKEWYAEKQKDPMFDPFAEDEEEGAPE